MPMICVHLHAHDCHAQDPRRTTRAHHVLLMGYPQGSGPQGTDSLSSVYPRPGASFNPPPDRFGLSARPGPSFETFRARGQQTTFPFPGPKKQSFFLQPAAVLFLKFLAHCKWSSTLCLVRSLLQDMCTSHPGSLIFATTQT